MLELLFLDWLKENLPDCLRVWISLNNENNWKTDNPLSFTKAKPKRVNGKVSKILPPTANIMAKKIRINIENNLTLFDIFFENTLLNHFIKK